jgi:hypothetical protein
MSSSKIKKTRKEIRKRVDNNLGDRIKALNCIVRKRPVWIPKRIWVLLYLPLFESKYRNLIIKYLE